MAANTSTSSNSGLDGDSIKVYVRVRPPQDSGDSAADCLQVDNENNAIVLKGKDSKVFTYDHVADCFTTQETVFSAVGRGLIESCVSGYNGTIFAYGQTGSGKTYTMLGPAEGCDNFQHELRGVIPRTFEHLFRIIQREKEMHGSKVEFLCKGSFLEIYNEQIFDLLDPTSSGLHVRENMKTGVFVDGLVETAVGTPLEAYEVLQNGWMNRTVASTSMNRESSRSHALFTITIESKKNENGLWTVKHSQLNLVDLAGSERQKDTNTTGVRLREAGSINKSLSCLGNVISALVDIARGKERYIPYRDSRLTFLLKDSLGGNAKTFIIANVHPGSKHYGETLSTLQFAKRAKQIKNKAVVNQDTTGNVLQLQMEITRLKQMLLQRGLDAPTSGANTSQCEGQEQGSGDSMTASDPEMKKNFINAMYFVGKTKSEVQSLFEKVSRLEENCKSKDRAIRQNKMVLKFREDALRKVEKAYKEKVALTGDEKDSIIEGLREENNVKKECAEHSADIARLEAENKSLRIENKNLRNASQEIDKKTMQDLENLYKQLKDEDKATSKGLPISTPKDMEGKVAVATAERQKSQIEHLQDENEKLTSDLQEMKKKHEEEHLKFTAEVESLKRSKGELETLFKAHQNKHQLDRQAIDQLHNDTIKRITPKKVKNVLHLRTRNVVVTGSGGQAPVDGDGSFIEAPDEELISDECQPPELIQDRTEALTAELKQIQEENNQLKTKLDSKAQELVKLVEDATRFESEKCQFEELLGKERNESSEKLSKLTEELKQLKNEHNSLMDSKKVSEEEVSDFKIVMAGMDREFKEMKATHKGALEKSHQERDKLESKLVAVEMQVGKVQRSLNDVQEERDQLKESVEQLQSTNDFNSEEIQKLQNKIESTQSELYESEKQLKQEREKNCKVCAQMAAEGDKEKLHQDEIAEKDKQIETIKDNFNQLVKQIEETQEEVAQAKMENEKYKNGETQLQMAIQDRTEKLGTLQKEAEELKSENEQKECELQSLRIQSEVNEKTVEEHKSTIVSLEQKVVEFVKQVEKMKEEEIALEQQHSSQMDMCQEDMESKESEIEQLKQSIEQVQNQNTTLEEKMKKLQEDLNKSESERDAAQQSLTDMSNMLQNTGEEQGRLTKTVEENKQLLEEKIIENAQLNMKLTDEKRNQQNIREEYHNLCGKLDEYTSRNAKLEVEVQNLNEKSKKLADLEKEHRCFLQRVQTAEQEYNEGMELLQSRVGKAEMDQLETEKINKKVLKDLENMESANVCLSDELEEAKEDVKRLQDVLKPKEEEIQRRGSEMERLSEEYSRCWKAYQEKEIEVKALEKKNAEIIGHQNHKQKVHYTQKLREEKQQIAEDLSKQYAKIALLKEFITSKGFNEELQKIEHKFDTKAPQQQAVPSAAMPPPPPPVMPTIPVMPAIQPLMSISVPMLNRSMSMDKAAEPSSAPSVLSYSSVLKVGTPKRQPPVLSTPKKNPLQPAVAQNTPIKGDVPYVHIATPLKTPSGQQPPHWYPQSNGKTPQTNGKTPGKNGANKTKYNTPKHKGQLKENNMPRY